MHFSFAEYLALEETGTVKHEFLTGQVWAMAGGSPEHAAIAAQSQYANAAPAVPSRDAVQQSGTPPQVTGAPKPRPVQLAFEVCWAVF